MDRWRWEESGRRREEERKSERRKIEKKEMQVREKVGKSWFTVCFQFFVGPEGRKVGSLKPQLRSHLASWDVAKVHAVVAWSTFPSQIGSSDVVFRGRRKGFCTLSKVSKTWGFCNSFYINYTTLHYATLIPIHYTTLRYLHYTTPHSAPPGYTTLTTATATTTLVYATLHYPTFITLHSLHCHKYNCNCTTLITLHHNYNSTTTTTTITTTTATTTTAAKHDATSSSCGWGDHCNHCNHSTKHNSNHLSVHQWTCSSIRASQQPTSHIGFLLWNFRHRLVRHYRYIHRIIINPFCVIVAGCSVRFAKSGGPEVNSYLIENTSNMEISWGFQVILGELSGSHCDDTGMMLRKRELAPFQLFSR